MPKLLGNSKNESLCNIVDWRQFNTFLFIRYNFMIWISGPKTKRQMVKTHDPLFLVLSRSFGGLIYPISLWRKCKEELCFQRSQVTYFIFLFFTFFLICPCSWYHTSLYTFRRNYSFSYLDIQRSKYIRAEVTVHKGAETVQGRKLYEEIR